MQSPEPINAPLGWTPEMIALAVQMINVLASTPPSEWCSKQKLYDELAQFRTPKP